MLDREECRKTRDVPLETPSEAVVYEILFTIQTPQKLFKKHLPLLPLFSSQNRG
jgi:hypothetical protein